MAWLLALLLTASPSARHEAERSAAQARSDRQSGFFKTALKEAEHAYSLDPKPAFLLEMAEDYRGLSDWANAATYFERYLATRPVGATRALARKRLTEARSHTGPGGADALAIAPLTGAAALVAPPLVQARPATPSDLPPPPLVELGTAPAPAVSDSPATSGGEISDSSTHHSRVLAYSLLGVGLAAVGVAVAGWVEVASFNSYVGSISPGTPGAQALSRQSQANTWQDVAIATTIVAGLAGGAVAFTW